MDARVERVLIGRTDEEVYALFADLGGHDVSVMLDALRRSKLDPIKPTLIVAHTIKGWGLDMAAAPGNHSALPDEAEVLGLLEDEGLTRDEPYRRFDADSAEGRYLAERGNMLRAGQEAIWALKDRNESVFRDAAHVAMPPMLGLNLKYLPTVYTQYVWGQLAAKLIRIGKEAGILDNLGSTVGVKCETLAVRKASKSGRPVDVYGYHGIDAEGIYKACGRVLSETALENVRISRGMISRGLAPRMDVGRDELWPPEH